MMSRLFPFRQRRKDARLRLFCFPYAGGGAGIYRAWDQYMMPEVEICAIQLPGREGRFRDRLLTSMPMLMDEIRKPVLDLIDRDYAIWGYSAGAIMAFALALEISEATGIEPRHLLVAACAAPAAVAQAKLRSSLDDSDLEEAIQEVRSGMPELFDVDRRDMLALVAPLVRADLRVIETFTAPAVPSLSCPISVFSGAADLLNPPERLDEWSEASAGPLRKLVFPGAHFFIHECGATVPRRVSAILDPEMARH